MHLGRTASVVDPCRRLPSQNDSTKNSHQRCKNCRPERSKGHGTAGHRQRGFHSVFLLLGFPFLIFVVAVFIIVAFGRQCKYERHYKSNGGQYDDHGPQGGQQSPPGRQRSTAERRVRHGQLRCRSSSLAQQKKNQTKFCHKRLRDIRIFMARNFYSAVPKTCRSVVRTAC